MFRSRPSLSAKSAIFAIASVHATADGTKSPLQAPADIKYQEKEVIFTEVDVHQTDEPQNSSHLSDQSNVKPVGQKIDQQTNPEHGQTSNLLVSPHKKVNVPQNPDSRESTPGAATEIVDSDLSDGDYGGHTARRGTLTQEDFDKRDGDSKHVTNKEILRDMKHKNLSQTEENDAELKRQGNCYEDMHNVTRQLFNKGVFVKNVIPGGAAERASGSEKGLCPGDEILQVNGRSLRNMTHSEAITYFQEIPLRVMLTIKRGVEKQFISSESDDILKPGDSGSEFTESDTESVDALRIGHRDSDLSSIQSMEENQFYDSDDGAVEEGLKIPKGYVLLSINVYRGPKDCLGISIVPSYGSTREYCQVKRVLPSGVCAEKGELREGDRLVSCNSISLKGLTQSECMEALNDAYGEVTLKVLRQVNLGPSMDINVTMTTKNPDTSENAGAESHKNLEVVGAEDRSIDALQLEDLSPAMQDQPHHSVVFAQTKVKLSLLKDNFGNGENVEDVSTDSSKCDLHDDSQLKVQSTSWKKGAGRESIQGTKMLSSVIYTSRDSDSDEEVREVFVAPIFITPFGAAVKAKQGEDCQTPLQKDSYTCVTSEQNQVPDGEKGVLATNIDDILDISSEDESQTECMHLGKEEDDEESQDKTLVKDAKDYDKNDLPQSNTYYDDFDKEQSKETIEDITKLANAEEEDVFDTIGSPVPGTLTPISNFHHKLISPFERLEKEFDLENLTPSSHHSEQESLKPESEVIITNTVSQKRDPASEKGFHKGQVFKTMEEFSDDSSSLYDHLLEMEQMDTEESEVDGLTDIGDRVIEMSDDFSLESLPRHSLPHFEVSEPLTLSEVTEEDETEELSNYDEFDSRHTADKQGAGLKGTNCSMASDIASPEEVTATSESNKQKSSPNSKKSILELIKELKQQDYNEDQIPVVINTDQPTQKVSTAMISNMTDLNNSTFLPESATEITAGSNSDSDSEDYIPPLPSSGPPPVEFIVNPKEQDPQVLEMIFPPPDSFNEKPESALHDANELLTGPDNTFNIINASDDITCQNWNVENEASKFRFPLLTEMSVESQEETIEFFHEGMENKFTEGDILDFDSETENQDKTESHDYSKQWETLLQKQQVTNTEQQDQTGPQFNYDLDFDSKLFHPASMTKEEVIEQAEQPLVEMASASNMTDSEEGKASAQPITMPLVKPLQLKRPLTLSGYLAQRKSQEGSSKWPEQPSDSVVKSDPKPALLKAKPLSFQPTSGAASVRSTPAWTTSARKWSEKSAIQPVVFQKRSPDQAFQIDVLKGILGLGLKVEVNPDGKAVVTEIQKTGPIGKNGQIRTGDILLSVNGQSTAGQSTTKLEQLLKFLPRGIIRLVFLAAKAEEGSINTTSEVELKVPVGHQDKEQLSTRTESTSPLGVKTDITQQAGSTVPSHKPIVLQKKEKFSENKEHVRNISPTKENSSTTLQKLLERQSPLGKQYVHKSLSDSSSVSSSDTSESPVPEYPRLPPEGEEGPTFYKTSPRQEVSPKQEHKPFTQILYSPVKSPSKSPEKSPNHIKSLSPSFDRLQAFVDKQLKTENITNSEDSITCNNTESGEAKKKTGPFTTLYEDTPELPRKIVQHSSENLKSQSQPSDKSGSTSQQKGAVADIPAAKRKEEPTVIPEKTGTKESHNTSTMPILKPLKKFTPFPSHKEGKQTADKNGHGHNSHVDKPSQQTSAGNNEFKTERTPVLLSYQKSPPTSRESSDSPPPLPMSSPPLPSCPPPALETTDYPTQMESSDESEDESKIFFIGSRPNSIIETDSFASSKVLPGVPLVDVETNLDDQFPTMVKSDVDLSRKGSTISRLALLSPSSSYSDSLSMNTARSKRSWSIASNLSEYDLASVSQQGDPMRRSPSNLSDVSICSQIPAEELQSLLEDANQSLDEAGAPDDNHIIVCVLHREIGQLLGVQLTAVDGAGGLLVDHVTPHSLADEDGRIQKGDHLLSISGKRLINVGVTEAQRLLRTHKQPLVLVLSRTGEDFKGELDNTMEVKKEEPGLSDSLIEVEMTKGVTGLGFCLEGGKDSPLGDRPITVKRIFKGGSAERSGVLRTGDELRTINGKNLTKMTHYQAWNMLKSLPEGKVTLQIKRK
ncbi:uncharacterized protein LOC106153557 [Lingula anatina]|uniref:Uncharacterized protein LOC106153557 n=1 Tax=Lingula anatina TaxID=7574 RepID=A0A1S3HCY9_LINAN|nr:uncharacterized protein LOC106153557 [Lingula anatina]|eukprot:XP_013382984.1 uncharacterized protein LOC106153557 [Lingula anatina]